MSRFFLLQLSAFSVLQHRHLPLVCRLLPVAAASLASGLQWGSNSLDFLDGAKQDLALPVWWSRLVWGEKNLTGRCLMSPWPLTAPPVASSTAILLFQFLPACGAWGLKSMWCLFYECQVLLHCFRKLLFDANHYQLQSLSAHFISCTFLYFIFFLFLPICPRSHVNSPDLYQPIWPPEINPIIY